jgi:cytidyltransferase-like protein
MKLVYTYLVMDLLHEGHLLYMKNAKALVGPEGRLIVGILTDEAVMEKKPKPILSFSERMKIAEAIKYIDIVVPQDTYSPRKNVEAIKPNILVESTSHSPEAIEEMRKVMEWIDGKVVVFPYFVAQSSTDIKKKIKEEMQ